MLNSIDALRSGVIVNYNRCICFGLYFISPINNNNNYNCNNKKKILKYLMVGLGMALKKTQETFLHYIAVLYQF